MTRQSASAVFVLPNLFRSMLASTFPPSLPLHSLFLILAQRAFSEAMARGSQAPALVAELQTGRRPGPLGDCCWGEPPPPSLRSEELTTSGGIRYSASSCVGASDAEPSHNSTHATVHFIAFLYSSNFPASRITEGLHTHINRQKHTASD